MFMLPQPTTPTPEIAAAQRAEDAHYYRRILHNLIDKGTDLANRLHEQAMAEPTPVAPANDEPEPIRGRLPAPGPAPIDFTLAFDRIARAIRRTITLARKLSEPEKHQAIDQARHRLAARKRIIRVVEDTIQRKGETPRSNAAIADLTAELYERLDAPDVDDDIDSRPVADIIEDILNDLCVGVFPGTRPFKRRTPADVAALQARAANLSLPPLAGENQSSPGLTRGPQPNAARPAQHHRNSGSPPASWLPRKRPG